MVCSCRMRGKKVTSKKSTIFLFASIGILSPFALNALQVKVLSE